uniref:Uncharacterized protein n=1 Tax=Fagus sylvatica TaxID=28930 RepID=A0A2N9HVJ7_FAGSY
MRILHSSDPVKVEKLVQWLGSRICGGVDPWVLTINSVASSTGPRLHRSGSEPLKTSCESSRICVKTIGELKPIELHEEPTELTGRIQAPCWRSLHGAGPAHADLAAQAGPSDLVAQDRS